MTTAIEIHRVFWRRQAQAIVDLGLPGPLALHRLMKAKRRKGKRRRPRWAQFIEVSPVGSFHELLDELFLRTRPFDGRPRKYPKGEPS